ncbi:MAG: helix-turn-helix transcriptional regulator [Dehalococcoidia bacterium]|nr:helix-turn-helix transcriptional regulator [Dehalococcoidia bacterium]
MSAASGDFSPDFSRMLGCNLRDWRRFRGLAVDDLAQRAGTTSEILSSYEAGDTGIDSNVLFELLSVLDVSLHELITSPGPADRGGSAITHMRPTEDKPTSEA